MLTGQKAWMYSDQQNSNIVFLCLYPALFFENIVKGLVPALNRSLCSYSTHVSETPFAFSFQVTQHQQS